jgi:adenylylsulfate kinase-like enzyme
LEKNHYIKGMIYWFTGQPGAGKTTLAKYLVEHFPKDNVIHIDGDDLRNAFNNKDYSEYGRRANVERAQYIAQFMNSKGFDVVVSLVAPYKDQRDRFKSQNSVIEIYVHTSEIRGRESFHVTEYEAPTENFIDIDTTTDNETDSYYKLLKNITL